LPACEFIDLERLRRSSVSKAWRAPENLLEVLESAKPPGLPLSPTSLYTRASCLALSRVPKRHLWSTDRDMKHCSSCTYSEEICDMRSLGIFPRTDDHNGTVTALLTMTPTSSYDRMDLMPLTEHRQVERGKIKPLKNERNHIKSYLCLVIEWNSD
jgi:hypothetical protein